MCEATLLPGLHGAGGSGHLSPAATATPQTVDSLAVPYARTPLADFFSILREEVPKQRASIGVDFQQDSSMRHVRLAGKAGLAASGLVQRAGCSCEKPADG